MGKDRDKQAGKSGAKKAKAGKLPKEILGVKLPKEARKAGDRLIEAARSDEGRRAIAGALATVAATAAAVAAAAQRRADRPAEPAADPAPPQDVAPAPGVAGTRDARPFDDVVGQVAGAMLGRLLAPRPPR